VAASGSPQFISDHRFSLTHRTDLAGANNFPYTAQILSDVEAMAAKDAALGVLQWYFRLSPQTQRRVVRWIEWGTTSLTSITSSHQSLQCPMRMNRPIQCAEEMPVTSKHSYLSAYISVSERANQTDATRNRRVRARNGVGTIHYALGTAKTDANWLLCQGSSAHSIHRTTLRCCLRG